MSKREANIILNLFSLSRTVPLDFTLVKEASKLKARLRRLEKRQTTLIFLMAGVALANKIEKI